MRILPAIDLKDGKVVRLYNGNFDTVHQVAEDPLATAAVFASAGAKYLHMVDLDGARNGQRKNGDIVARVVAQSGLSVELGGGIRTMEDLERVSALGVQRMIIGSAAVSNPELTTQAVARYGDRIAVGLDTLEGQVRTEGWEKDGGISYLKLAAQMEENGVTTLIFTDIATDGMLSGPSYARLAELQRTVSCRIIASGGVTVLDDIKRLRDMGLYGAIVGKAYYAGTLDLTQVIKEAGDPC